MILISNGFAIFRTGVSFYPTSEAPKEKLNGCSSQEGPGVCPWVSLFQYDLSPSRTFLGEKKTVKLGFVADITGPGFLIALSQKTALELGLEEINSSGGLLGRRVELIIRDSQMKPDLGARQTQDLIPRIRWILSSGRPALR